MSTSPDDASAPAAATEAASSSRTANGATDLLDEKNDGSGSISVADIVSEASALAPSQIEGVGDEEDTSDAPTSDDAMSSSSSTPKRPSIATVTAIVNEVLRQKESGASGNTDIASIASREVDKFYDDTSSQVTDDSLPPPGARPPKRFHPWNSKKGGGDETKSLFRRSGSGGRGSAALISSKFKAAIGSSSSRAAKAMEENYDDSTSTPPNNMFQRKTSSGGVDVNSPDFNDLCSELGITPETHPQVFEPYRYKHFHFSPESVMKSKTFQYCLIVTGFVALGIMVASGVTKGFQHVEKHDAELHPKWIKEGTEANDTTTGNGNMGGEDYHGISEIDILANKNKLAPEEIEQLSYKLEDAYLAIWFDRSTGWNGNTYQEAMEFCKSRDDFVPCPYDV